MVMLFMPSCSSVHLFLMKILFNISFSCAFHLFLNTESINRLPKSKYTKRYTHTQQGVPSSPTPCPPRPSTSYSFIHSILSSLLCLTLLLLSSNHYVPWVPAITYATVPTNLLVTLFLLNQHMSRSHPVLPPCT